MLNFIESVEEIKKIKNKSYCLIIGGHGTRNARSPKIWNKILIKNNINCKMIPIEIQKKFLNSLLDFVKNDDRFLGGSIGVPYKEDIFRYLGKNIDNYSKKIGSVNCLYKKRDKNLYGINTDGLGFLETLKKNKINKNYKNVLLLGFGGAGKSVLVYLKKFFSKETNIYCTTRKNYSRKINSLGCIWISWKKRQKIFNKLNMIINSTSLGYDKMKNKVAIKISKSKQLKVVYDIIYKPNKTLLIYEAKKFNIKTINGLDMNMLQAIFAIKKVFKNKIKFVK